MRVFSSSSSPPFFLSIPITRAFASVYSHKAGRWWYPPSHIPPTLSIRVCICLSNTQKKIYIYKEQEKEEGDEEAVLFRSSFLWTNTEQIQLDRLITTMIININRFTTETTFVRFFHSSSLYSYTVKTVLFLMM